MTLRPDTLPGVAHTSWHDEALCAKLPVDPDMFFPDRFTAPHQIKAAKSVCARCPVREECLDYALSVPRSHDHGVWGGTTQAERQRMRQ